MQQAEVFHIYHLGEQRGPYSARQVNHLYRCGFIGDETLYWRDGMEQWLPITDIVERRIRRNRLMKWAVTLGVVAILGFLAVIFGPVTRDAWREMTSGEFSSESAWWRARGLVREKMLNGAHVTFDGLASAQVELSGKDAAMVILGGNVTDENGKTAHSSWKVRMQYDAERKSWNPAPSKPTPQERPTAQEPIPAPTQAATDSRTAAKG